MKLNVCFDKETFATKQKRTSKTKNGFCVCIETYLTKQKAFIFYGKIWDETNDFVSI